MKIAEARDHLQNTLKLMSIAVANVREGISTCKSACAINLRLMSTLDKGLAAAHDLMNNPKTIAAFGPCEDEVS